MRKFILSLLLLGSFNCFAQRSPVRLNFGAGVALLGTGDIAGSVFFAEAELPFKKTSRFTISPALQFTNHAETIYFASGIKHRTVVSGISAWLKLDYAILLRERHRITIGAGPSLRFQSSSDFLSAGTRRDPAGNLVTEINYEDAFNTYAPGYIIAPQYQFMISKRVALGLRFMLQNDTRGDVVTSQVFTTAIHL